MFTADKCHQRNKQGTIRHHLTNDFSAGCCLAPKSWDIRRAPQPVSRHMFHIAIEILIHQCGDVNHCAIFTAHMVGIAILPMTPQPCFKGTGMSRVCSTIPSSFRGGGGFGVGSCQGLVASEKGSRAGERGLRGMCACD